MCISFKEVTTLFVAITVVLKYAAEQQLQQQKGVHASHCQPHTFLFSVNTHVVFCEDARPSAQGIQLRSKIIELNIKNRKRMYKGTC